MTLKNNAKYLRTHMTDAETKLWYYLRGHRFSGLKFKRQKPIGPYIVDFVCIRHALIIEVDGGQHQNSDDDQQRDTWFHARGWQVLRFWNHDVLCDIESVLDAIYLAVFGDSTPSPPAPLPQAGEGSNANTTPMQEGSQAHIPRSFPFTGEGRTVNTALVQVEGARVTASTRVQTEEKSNANTPYIPTKENP